jgi:predicted transcriptional regulator
MSKDVLILDKSTSLQDAAEHMKKLSVGCVIVTDSNIPVRIITKRDFMTKIAAEGRPLFT